MNTRYLTPEAKAEELAAWEKSKLSPRRSEHHGGEGFADPEVFGLCDRINALPDWCTLQSCCGHNHPAPEDPTENVRLPGQLWLWPMQRAAAAFYLQALIFAESRFIEQVTFLWGRWQGREIVDIRFEGEERGHLVESSAAILEMLETSCTA